MPISKTRLTANDDEPVFGSGVTPTLIDLDNAQTGDWCPPRIRGPRGVEVLKDGPSIEWRLVAQGGRLTSNPYSGQAANDNQDWPLAKTLRAEDADYHLSLAERYRDLYEAANRPCELRGTDLADNVYLMHRTDIDASTGALVDKGAKRVTGRKAKLDEQPKRAAPADPDKTKKRAKPVPKKWAGDWPLLHKIDSNRELAAAQAALGWLREGFEASVCHGETFETVGREHGVGNKTGAKGAGRALVMLGLQAVDEFWQKPARRAA